MHIRLRLDRKRNGRPSVKTRRDGNAANKFACENSIKSCGLNYCRGSAARSSSTTRTRAQIIKVKINDLNGSKIINCGLTCGPETVQCFANLFSPFASKSKSFFARILHFSSASPTCKQFHSFRSAFCFRRWQISLTKLSLHHFRPISAWASLCT